MLAYGRTTLGAKDDTPRIERLRGPLRARPRRADRPGALNESRHTVVAKGRGCRRMQPTPYRNMKAKKQA